MEYRLFNISGPKHGGTQVIMRQHKRWIYAQGFSVMLGCLIYQPLSKVNISQVVVHQIIILGDIEGMLEKQGAVTPVSNLYPCNGHQKNERHNCSSRQERLIIIPVF